VIRAPRGGRRQIRGVKPFSTASGTVDAGCRAIRLQAICSSGWWPAKRPLVAVQLRKAVVENERNLLTRAAMEMARDSWDPGGALACGGNR